MSGWVGGWLGGWTHSLIHSHTHSTTHPATHPPTHSLIHLYMRLQTGEIVHQVCHALGIWHEHQRPDRDQYIEVMTGNIEDRELGDFRSVPSTVIDTADLPYDYTSLMHFHGKVSAQPFVIRRPTHVGGLVPLKVGRISSPKSETV